MGSLNELQCVYTQHTIQHAIAEFGFIHSGSPLPFIYDIADLYKADLTIDLAFQLVSKSMDIYDRRVLIDAFCERLVNMKILERIIPDIQDALSVEK